MMTRILTGIGLIGLLTFAVIHYIQAKLHGSAADGLCLRIDLRPYPFQKRALAVRPDVLLPAFVFCRIAGHVHAQFPTV